MEQLFCPLFAITRPFLQSNSRLKHPSGTKERLEKCICDCRGWRPNMDFYQIDLRRNSYRWKYNIAFKFHSFASPTRQTRLNLYKVCIGLRLNSSTIRQEAYDLEWQIHKSLLVSSTIVLLNAIRLKYWDVPTDIARGQTNCVNNELTRKDIGNKQRVIDNCHA